MIVQIVNNDHRPIEIDENLYFIQNSYGEIPQTFSHRFKKY